MSHKLGIGIIGYGHFADKWLRLAIPNSQQARLVAVQVRSRSVEIPGVSIYADISDLLADPQVDAVYVTSPNELHEEHVRLSLEAGKHVLCEKPMAVLPAQGRRMIAAAQYHQRYLAVGHMLRFSPALRQAKALLDKGALGTPLYARAEFSYHIDQKRRSWVADKSIAGGGALLDGGIHCLDSLRYLMESQSLSVHACVMRPAAELHLETSASCLLEFSGGCSFHLGVHSQAPYGSILEIAGSHGRLKVEGFVRCAGTVSLEFRSEQAGASVPALKVIDVNGVFENQIDAFCNMARNNFDDVQSAENGLKNIEIIEESYQRNTDR